VVLKWTAVTNADPVKYRVLFDKVSPPTQVLTDTTGLIVSTSQLPNGELLDSSQTYYAQVIAHDADGDGPPSAIVTGSPVLVPADAVTEDVLVANQFFSREAYFGTISVNQLETGTLTATIDVTTGHLTVGAITIDQTSGIRIPLVNGGLIQLPADGSNAIFRNVYIDAGGAFFDEKVELRGDDNLLSGRMLLAGTIQPPGAAPVVISTSAPAPTATLSAPSSAYAGLGDTGANWQTSSCTLSRSETSTPASYGLGAIYNGTAQAAITAYNINKTTGVVSTAYNLSTSGFYSWTNSRYSVTPPTPVVTSFHSTAGHGVYIVYRPKFTYTQVVFTGGWYILQSVTQGGDYVVCVTNAAGALQYQWVWSSFDSWTYPGVFTDDTYVYVGATNRANSQVYFYRYGLNGTGGVNVAISPTQHSANWTGLYVGNADYGSLRYILSYASGSMHVFDSTGTIQNSEVWVRSNNDPVRGIVYNVTDTRFYTHGTSSKIWPYAKNTVSIPRLVKYTWYDSAGTVHESIPSPVSSVSQDQRSYIQVSTQPAPNGGDPDDPNTVRIYIDGHRQADVSPGVTTVTYEIPSTGNPDAPALDGFAALGGHGSFESSIKSPARVQQVTISGVPSGGSFALVYAGSPTAAIAFNATATTVQTTLNNLLATLGVGTVVVGGGPGPGTPWIISFSATSPAHLSAVNNLTGGLAPRIDITDGEPVTQFEGDGSWHLSNMTGTIIAYAGISAPDGFLLCDGTAVSRVTYADLYRVIGTIYGAGDGSTTFNLPDLRGRTVVGVNAGDVEFQTLGQKSGHKSLQAHSHGGGTGLNNASHTHGVPIQYATTTSTSGSGYRITDVNNAAGGGGTAVTAVSNGQSANHAHAVGSDGAGNAQNIQPSIALNYLIKV
jgi:microcystin-dependent protein